MNDELTLNGTYINIAYHNSRVSELEKQLAASQRRADAAVEDIYKMTDGGECDICKHYNPDKNTCAKPFVPYDDCFEWRGAKGGAE